MSNLSNQLAMAAAVFTLTVTTPTLAMAATSAVPSQPVDLTYAAEKALPSVVHIKYLQNSKVQTVDVESDPFGDFFDPFGFFGNPGGNGGTQKRKVQTPKREGAGSGVIISTDGYIVTNNHVVEGADELTVTLNDNKEYSARIIGTDKTTDLALIKITASNLPALPIGDSDKLKVGEWVLAVGNPFNLNSTVTAGIVSAKARSLGANGIESFIQTDAAINAGNSGGALVNTRGELVGINAMLYSQTGSYSGYGFAIPTTIMNKVVADLKKYGTVQRGLLGIQGINVNNYYDQQKEQGKELDLGTMEGVYVAKVEEEGSAAEAGLKEGDVITAVDGKKVVKMSELQEYLTNKRPGDKVTITYLRKKAKKTATLTLKNEQGNTNIVKDADLDVLGGTFRPVTEQEKKDMNISYGLAVTKVANGALKDAAVYKGFIILQANDTPMKTLNDLQKAVKDASTSKDPVLILKGISPTGKKAYFAVMLDKQ
ncbi:Do family serine endopeptidase [uncultured Prevotella sp.]|uniref:Do family serine endopeptidase n=1 Tax=uncultured Prevotella sp. TaxID=159272 RepID=UPI0026163DA7|nr:Do family serine endopeptidase [uncultured Prevotella sp.]